MEIDDRFLDVAFERQPEYVFGAKESSAFSKCAAYEDTEEVLTDAEIDAIVEKMDAGAEPSCEDLITRIFNQSQEGSCVANATTQSDEIVQGLQFGKENVVHLSAISLYKRIGSSPNSGASVDDGLDEMEKRGIVPLDTPENRATFGDCVMPNTGFRTPYPANWEATAIKFAGREYKVIRSVNGLYSALCRRRPVVVGRAGHSICYVRPTRKSGRRIVKYVNSWGAWGDKGGDFEQGFGYDSDSLIRQSASWCFALCSVANREAA